MLAYLCDLAHYEQATPVMRIKILLHIALLKVNL